MVTEQVAPANSRVTFYPRGEHAALASAEFSTVIESLTAGNLVIAERAMYFDDFRSGHDALGVTGPSTTWLFAEGFTGGNAQTAFETFLLLANTGDTDTVATVDYLLDNGQVVTPHLPPARPAALHGLGRPGRPHLRRPPDGGRIRYPRDLDQPDRRGARDVLGHAVGRRPVDADVPMARGARHGRHHRR